MGDQEDGVPHVRVEGDEHRVVVRVGGEMDLDRAPILRGALHAVITQPDAPGEIVLDLAELTFCDSTGLNAFLQARLTALEHGLRISLHAPPGQFLRLLAMTGTAALFPITYG
ncbi:STAS domain-containing protein [Streptomyces sp. NPDC006512]|uniref:STAS domain-containing protein n=1 Tax=Streptomyces sp. NPDC006512 TaxID=3154307 RepID=UPI0033BDFCD7